MDGGTLAGGGPAATPLPDGALRIVARRERKDEAA
jgi:hypothetical protein